MKYLWPFLHKITPQLENFRTKVLILDYDGTLTPIVKKPEMAKLPDTTKNYLQQLAGDPRFHLAIVSGRSLGDLKEKVRLPKIIYGANHGLEGEIYGEEYSYPLKLTYRKALKDILKQLTNLTADFKGAFVEDKNLTLSLHYRLTNSKSVPKLKLLAGNILKPFIKNKLVAVIDGKKVIDIMPEVPGNKGYFTDFIVKKIATQKNAKCLTIAIGDDATDDDVFKCLKNGITISVGKNPRSHAKYYLKSQKEVIKFLKFLISCLNDQKSAGSVSKPVIFKPPKN